MEQEEEEEGDHACSVPATYMQRACSVLCSLPPPYLQRTCGELPPRDAVQPRLPFFVGRLRNELVASQRPAESITADGRRENPQSTGCWENCIPPLAL